MNERQIEFTVDKSGERLDKLVVAQVTGLSRAQVQALIHEGAVTVNGTQVKSGIKLRGGEVVCITLPPPVDNTIEAEDIALNVVYSDDVLAVIDKPAGMVVHPGTGNQTGTLVNALLALYPEVAALESDEGRMGIVHRLDKDTSGLIIIAKTAAALHNLMTQFQSRSVEKHYTALVERTPATVVGRIEAPIARDPHNRKRMAVQRDGKPAITEFTILDADFKDGQALVNCNLLTGRTHQIRVHMAFIGSPIVGDRVYGFRKQRLKMKRLFLHAARLCFDHPASGERVCFESPLPATLQNILTKLRE